VTRPPPPTYAKLGVTDARVAVDLRIFLDAVPQRFVVEYDTEAGYVVRYVVLQDGTSHTGSRQIPRFKVVGDKVETERVEGIVEVMWRDDP
jgi:hypothetical protein